MPGPIMQHYFRTSPNPAKKGNPWDIGAGAAFQCLGVGLSTQRNAIDAMAEAKRRQRIQK